MLLLKWLLGRRRRFRVDGRSMLPTLAPGDHVFVDPRARYARGDVIVAQHPFKSDVVLVKRVGDIGDDGRVELLSDNPAEGSDSRTLGRVAPGQVFGAVVARI